MIRMVFYSLFAAGFALHGISQDTLNQTDENGLKQGYWIISSEMKPEKGYPKGTRIEEGIYLDDRKNGLWKKYHKDGKTVRLIGTYKNNRPGGEYWKFYPSGVLMEHGFFWSPSLSKGTHQSKVHVFERYYKSGCLQTIVSDTSKSNYNDDCILPDSVGSVFELKPIYHERPYRITEYPKFEFDSLGFPMYTGKPRKDTLKSDTLR